MVAASGEPSGNPWELTDDALEPGSRLGRSAAVHATEFGPTGAPRIAAAQEHTATDPLPQRERFRETEGAADKVIGGETDQQAGPLHPSDCVRADGVSSRNSDKHRDPIYFPDALLDSGASASLIGDEVLRHLQQKSVRVRHEETTFQLACGSTTLRGA
ncbi:hypothetical protein HPB47_017338, partial [Ixodes persulcatus]